MFLSGRSAFTVSAIMRFRNVMHHYHWSRSLASRGPPQLHSYLERARLIRTERLPEPTHSVESCSGSVEMTDGEKTHLNIPAT